MAALSWQAWRRARHRPRGEGLTAAAVLVLAAVLVAFPVPPGRAGDDLSAAAAADTEGLPQRGDLTLARPVADTVVGLSIRPAEPGTNDLLIHLIPPGGDGADGTPVPTRRCGDACRVVTAPLDSGTTLTVRLAGPPETTGSTTFVLPDLPAPDGTALVTALRHRMHRLHSVRYDEQFGTRSHPAPRQTISVPTSPSSTRHRPGSCSIRPSWPTSTRGRSG
ncbi:MAG TPA: hypothetical protein VGA36_07300 [Nitriliruptorales bacterium]